MSSPLDYGRSPRPNRLAEGYAAARQNGRMLGQVAALGVGLVLVLLVAGGVLSLVGPWLIIGLTAVLAAVVYVRSRRVAQRQWWVDNNCCAACGYDLDVAPTRTCPQCGRDATQDEPVWRRLRREHEAKYGRPPQPAETYEASQLDEADIRRLLAKANESLQDL